MARSGWSSKSLYPKRDAKRLSPALFRNPTAEYRGTPFWSWNDRLDLPQLKRQIDQLRRMGFGGFHVHSRTGLADEYLGETYLHALKVCTDLAAKKRMLSWLYDEDRWPSGSAGGIVTRDPQYRMKHLLWTCTPYRTDGSPVPVKDSNSGSRSEDGMLLSRYEVRLEDGLLTHHRRLAEGESGAADATIWYAYCESPQPSTWFNGQTYVDTLSRPAIERFIQVTHIRLKKLLGKYFGNVVPAIFTDEPQFTKKTSFKNAEDRNDQFLPWTSDFPATYEAAFNHDLLDHLPLLFWNLPDGRHTRVRWRYHEHVAERFASAFSDTIGNWCDRNGIAFTGHMLGEATLSGQSRGVGEAMRGLRSFHIPGIDILCDKLEFTTAKQAQSVARQFDRPGVLSELYGVTNWDYDFVGHKAQGDWQAALGVTVRVPHLTWQSMRGEAKRDYPAPIGYQSPWYLEYPLIENHFARVNTVLTRGKPIVRIAVIHPLESNWINFGSQDRNGETLGKLEEQFKSLTHWLLENQLDFDFVSESLLPAHSDGDQSGSFRVGVMKYDVVLVPALHTIRSTTLDRLESFASSGGEVIFIGAPPSHVDAEPSNRASSLAVRVSAVAFEKELILQLLDRHRDFTIFGGDKFVEGIISQLRADGDHRSLFLCNLDRKNEKRKLKLRMPGTWKVTHLNTFKGKNETCPARYVDNQTEISVDLAAHGHLLLQFSPGKSAAPTQSQSANWKRQSKITGAVPITLSEPNVLLLDRAEWRINDGPWQQREELLRIDNTVRRQLNLPLRGPRVAQPWADQSPAPVVGNVQLRFQIDSRVQVTAPQLAMEDPALCQIELNGKPISNRAKGWWVDECIERVKLPSFNTGKQQLILTIPMTRRTNIEWCYLLGDFGVKVSGDRAWLTKPVTSLKFGDWVPQGLPFYAGNVTYHCEIKGSGKQQAIEVDSYKSPLLSIDLKGRSIGKIAFAPYRVELGSLKGKHTLDITAYGNRVNAFGPIHHTNKNLQWVGPAAWRSEGEWWSDAYQLKPMGILKSPRVLVRT